MTKNQIITSYRVLQELEKDCTSSNHNSIVVVKNILANKIMELELNESIDEFGR